MMADSNNFRIAFRQKNCYNVVIHSERNYIYETIDSVALGSDPSALRLWL